MKQRRMAPVFDLRNFLLRGLLAILLFSHCIATSKVDIVTDHNELEGFRKTHTVGNLVVEQTTATGGFVYELFLNALRLDWRTGERLYYLVVRYNGIEGLLLRTDKPLVLTVDGARLSLPGEGAGAEDRAIFQGGDGPYVTEQARYQLTAAQLTRLASASEASVKISGEKRSLEIRLSPRNLRAFKQFVAQYVKARKP
ncbi:MAG: hypothetical protein ACE5IY_19295 [bacterium]